MYLLKRCISPYSGYDQILGVTKDLETAKVLKKKYIEKRLTNDIWGEQAYHDVNLEKDTVIEDISVFFKEKTNITSKFFLVCHLEDYSGLCSLKVHKIFTRIEVAKTYIENFYEYCDLIEDYECHEVFSPEKITEEYLKSIYEKLDLDENKTYFEQWGGILKIYEVTENRLREEDLPSYPLSENNIGKEVKEKSLFQSILAFFNKWKN